MSGEMLRHRHHAYRGESFGKRHAERCHAIGIIAEGAVADYRILRVAIHIEHRTEIHICADGALLQAEDAPYCAGVVDGCRGADGHEAREAHSVADAHTQPLLRVGGGENRHFRQRHGAVVDSDVLPVVVALVNHDAANVVDAHNGIDTRKSGGEIVVMFAEAYIGEDELGNAVAQR